ncbi:hypothetical protein BGZ65_006202, partial [Modicella reniformis]
MVFSNISSPRGKLSLQQVLELANVYLENASKVNDPTIALVPCHDTEVALGYVKEPAENVEEPADKVEEPAEDVEEPAEDPVENVEDQSLYERIASTFIGLGRLLDSQGYRDEALAFYKKSEKW